MPHTIQHFFTSQSNPTQYHHQYYCATVLSQKKRNTWLSTVPYTEGANFTVNLKNSGATQCWQWGSPISKKQKMAAWTQSQCPNTYNHLIVRQEYCKLIHWHSHNNKKEIHDCTYFCIQREPNHCEPENSDCTQCWQWGSPIRRKQKKAAWTQSQCPNTYNHRIMSQECCNLIYWRSHYGPGFDSASNRNDY